MSAYSLSPHAFYSLIYILMKDLVFFGIQGSGKGTQAKILLDKIPDVFSYFSTGDVFRSLTA